MFHWYGFFIGLAVLVGYTIAESIEPKVNRVAPWVIGLGLLGARVYHVIDLWEYYSTHLWQMGAIWQGGLSIWGGLLGGGVGLVIGERREERGERWSVLGAIVTALPLAQAIGRLGNAVNGEFTQRVWVLPWWGAEAILDLILFGLLWRFPVRRRIFVYLAGYGLIRLVLQPYRL